VHEATNPGILCSGEQIACSLDHDSLELLTPALPNRDEVDDRVDAGNRGSETRRIGEVALRQLATPGREPGSPAGITHEAANGQVAAAQLVHDVAPHEACASRDQDQPVGSFWKFCQYFEGVGPRWPWYFEPMSPVP
jgi:hypothetical protein